ncbi:MAG: PP2C family protein-serine/threonine phosphatase [Bacteroidota bacterium]|nr:PP2C family protein-serine/threonine phosphatase [Bacteroidota bacterium]
MSLIPKVLPKVPKFEFAACTIPAHEVGGDLYDFIHLNDKLYELVIADVAGKGLPAALLATLIKGVLFSQAMQGYSPQAHLKGSNKIVRSNFPRKTFITAMLAVINVEKRSLTIANAGHCHPIMYHSRKEAVSTLPIKGMALNIEDEILCEERTIILEHGDCIVLYSDGVCEAENRAGDFVETERIEILIHKHGKDTAEAIMKNILREVEEFSKGAPQHDDITIIVVKAR